MDKIWIIKITEGKKWENKEEASVEGIIGFTQLDQRIANRKNPKRKHQYSLQLKWQEPKIET